MWQAVLSKAFPIVVKKLFLRKQAAFEAMLIKVMTYLLAAFSPSIHPAVPKKTALSCEPLGIPPILDVFWERDLTILRNLLEELGCQVNTFWGEGEGLTQLQRAGQACLNLVLSDIYGANTIAAFQRSIRFLPCVLPFPLAKRQPANFYMKSAMH